MSVTINDVQSFLETNKDSEDVKKLAGGFITTDRVSAFLDSEDGKKVIQPKLDSHVSKSIETWKANNLQKIIDEEITKRNPAETAEQKRIRELESKQQTSDRKIAIAENKAKYLDKASADKIPIPLLNFIVSHDETETASRYAEVKNLWTTELEKQVTAILGKNASRLPTRQNDQKGGGINSAIRRAAGYS